MLNPETKSSGMSCDIYWLEKLCAEYNKFTGTIKTMVDNDSDDKELETNQNNREE